MGVTASELARHLGISHTAVAKAVKAGRIKKGSNGFDLEACRKAWGENTNASKVTIRGKRTSDQPAEVEPTVADGTMSEALRRKEWLRVRAAEDEEKIRRGEYVPVAEINSWVAGMIVRAKDVLMRIPSEVRDRLATETDPILIDELLTDSIERALVRLSEYKAAA